MFCVYDFSTFRMVVYLEALPYCACCLQFVIPMTFESSSYIRSIHRSLGLLFLRFPCLTLFSWSFGLHLTDDLARAITEFCYIHFTIELTVSSSNIPIRPIHFSKDFSLKCTHHFFFRFRKYPCFCSMYKLM